MGLFDFFKDGDDDYEESHKGQSKESSFDATQFENSKELIAWLEKNKAILLSEDDGLVVYTNDADENFLQIYSSLEEAEDDDLKEYVEVNSDDLRDLLNEMPDIMYVVLNPNTDNRLITRADFLTKEDQIQQPQKFEKTTENYETANAFFQPTEKTANSTKNQSVAVPLDFEVTSEKDEAMAEAKVPKDLKVDAFQFSSNESAAPKAAATTQSAAAKPAASKSEATKASPAQSESVKAPAAAKAAASQATAAQSAAVKADSATKSESVQSKSAESAQASSADVKVVENKDSQAQSAASEKTQAAPATAEEKPKEKTKNLNYQAVSVIPKDVIEKILQFKKDGIKKFYLAEQSQENKKDKEFTLLLDAKSVHAQKSLPMTKILVKDNSAEAKALENKKYLVYDEEAVQALAKSYSENEVLSYLQENPLVYTAPVYNEEVSGNEITVFTDFTQIPSLFLHSFDTFKVMNYEALVKFLEKDGSIGFIHVNPFSNPLYITREIVIAQKYQVKAAPNAQGNQLDIVYTDDKSTALVYLITTLKDFSLINLKIGDEASKNVVLTFKDEKVAGIAKQVLKMKTDYKVK